MPLQDRPSSRSPTTQDFANCLSAPHTLAPFLDNLPSPASTLSDQRTPTAHRYGDRGPHRPSASPTLDRRCRRRGATITKAVQTGLQEEDDDDEEEGGGEGEKREEEEERGEEDSDYDPTLDDADFQSHYSVSTDNSDLDSPISDSGGSEDGRGRGRDRDREWGRGRAGEEQQQQHMASPSMSPPGGIGGGGGGGSSSIHHSMWGSQSPTAPPPLPLFPPFYNRPPTQLPPSPSLTSLLRPPSLLNRSTTSTRPTTPDSSDVETPNDTEAAVAQSARRATVVSRVSPKVPTYEYYGFVLYLASSLAFLLYLLWSYLPSPFLAAIGLHYYPNRWWSLAIPSFLVVLLVYIYVALLSYNVEYLTLPMESLECIVDDAANIAVLDGKGRLRRGGSRMDLGGSMSGGNGSWGRNGAAGAGAGAGSIPNWNHNGHRRWGAAGGQKIQWRNLWSVGTDAVMDIPIGGVCEVLYGEGRDVDQG